MEHSIDKELKRLEQELCEPLRQAVQNAPAPSETAALIAALQPEFAELQAQTPQNARFQPARRSAFAAQIAA
ncbi:hypothetical protein HMSSN036_48310 [Paenibacillus macerans]|nr:hypothetical protein HMSSN036_48310 [Paenibacillus macerans]